MAKVNVSELIELLKNAGASDRRYSKTCDDFLL